jgi:hypothetical protein
MTEIIDMTERGDEKIFKVLTASTFNRRAKAKARREVHPMIPLRDQKVINETVDKDLGIRKRYIITITHNKDKYGLEGY